MLDAIITGPESRKRARRAAIRRILYKVAVTHWLSEEREKAEDYSYDNAFRRENDQAFFMGVRSLFEYLSGWTENAPPMSLGIVLQAETVYTSDQDGEPDTYVADGTEKSIASYRAKFIQDCHLPNVSCISSLGFPEAWTPSDMGSENRVSPAAALKIASACGGDALQEVELDGAYEIPPTDTALVAEKRTTTANNLSRLPSSVYKVDIRWSANPSVSEIPSATFPLPTIKIQPDALSAALRSVSIKLKDLRTDELDILPEFFCLSPYGSQSISTWTHLEKLQLRRVPFCTPFGDHLHFSDASTSRDVLVENYFDKFYESVGFAVQKTPKIEHLLITFGTEDQELDLVVRRGRGFHGLNFYDGYQFSPQVIQAWKLDEGQLREGNAGWQEAGYKTWPPSWDIE